MKQVQLYILLAIISAISVSGRLGNHSSMENERLDPLTSDYSENSIGINLPNHRVLRRKKNGGRHRGGNVRGSSNKGRRWNERWGTREEPGTRESTYLKEPSTGQKLTADQKRQNQRDERRFITNPDRTWWEEDAERQRKDEQAKRRFNPRGDPYHRSHGDSDYAWHREKGRRERCKNTGSGCNYHALDWKNGGWKWDSIHDEYYPGAWP